jgi:hypothetical protein
MGEDVGKAKAEGVEPAKATTGKQMPHSLVNASVGIAKK